MCEAADCWNGPKQGDLQRCFPQPFWTNLIVCPSHAPNGAWLSHTIRRLTVRYARISNRNITPKGVSQPLAIEVVGHYVCGYMHNLLCKCHSAAFYRFGRTKTGPTVQLQWDMASNFWFIPNFWNICFYRGLWPNPCKCSKLVLNGIGVLVRW